MINVLDLPLARRFTFIRKGAAFGLKALRVFFRFSEAGKPRSFPVFVNSIPKSGTHLLMQLARELPGTRYFGSFVAQQPSLTLKSRPQIQIDSMLSDAIGGEVVGAHLHYSKATSDQLEKVGALHLFIIRDPADVLMSEAHYLGHMNRYHKMSSEFKGLGFEESLMLAFSGSEKNKHLFPSYQNRIIPYLGWLDDPNTVVVRYEDIVNPAKVEATIGRIVSAWSDRAVGLDDFCPKALVRELSQAIAPSRSHTFSGRKKRYLELSRIQLDEINSLQCSMGYSEHCEKIQEKNEI